MVPPILRDHTPSILALGSIVLLFLTIPEHLASLVGYFLKRLGLSSCQGLDSFVHYSSHSPQACVFASFYRVSTLRGICFIDASYVACQTLHLLDVSCMVVFDVAVRSLYQTPQSLYINITCHPL